MARTELSKPVPCRLCREDTTRLSRICVACQRKRRRKTIALREGPWLVRPERFTDLLHPLPDGTLVRVVQWFSGREEWQEEITAALPALRARCGTYKLKVAQWLHLVARQRSRCAICDTELHPLALNIDHDHESGHVRGLLCTPCNTGLGALGIDGPCALHRVERIAAYLREGKSLHRELRLVNRPESDVTWIDDVAWAQLLEGGDRFRRTFGSFTGVIGSPEEYLRHYGYRPMAERPKTA